jgi:hypothetical protein
MEWVAVLLLQALPALIVLSVLLVLVPSLRRQGSWRGIGFAWLAVFIGTLIIAVTHPNEWSLSCRQLPPAPGVFFPSEPCTASNTLPVWMSALPVLVGIAILLVWVLRSIHPVEAALRMIGILVVVTAGILGVAQLNPNVALLLLLAAAVFAFAWPRIQEERAG